MLKKLLFVVMCLVCGNVFCENYLPSIAQIPGGIVKLSLPLKSNTKPVVLYEKNRVFVTAGETKLHWDVVIGLPLLAYPGQHHIEIVHPNERIPFYVKRKYYTRENITLKNNHKVNPSESDKKKVATELNDISKTLAHWSEIVPFTTKFILPVEGSTTNTFGIHKIYNGVSVGPNKTMDIYVKAGTAVHPSAPGIVINTADYFYLGKTVFIDHGQGVISSYSHLKDIKVRKGRHVSNKSVIGLVGATGRAAQPHLSWGVYMNQNAVNPKLFL